MADVASSIRGVSTQEAPRCLVRHVYRHTQESAGETPGAVLLSPVMVWMSQLARSSARALRCASSAGLPTVRRLPCSTYRPAQWPTC